MRSGFVTVVGRPNVGKSSLLNAMVGAKVSIVSDKPQTTRRQVRGILTRDDGQLVFVDTPGLHKAETALGERCNQSALDAASGVDVVVLVVDATKPAGTGDRWVAAPSAPRSTSGSPKKASSVATITSALPTSPIPPPTQNPATAAMTGTSHS